MKYELTLDWIIKLAPNLKLSDLDRVSLSTDHKWLCWVPWKTNNYGFSPSSKRMLARMLSMKGY